MKICKFEELSKVPDYIFCLQSVFVYLSSTGDDDDDDDGDDDDDDGDDDDDDDDDEKEFCKMALNAFCGAIE